MFDRFLSSFAVTDGSPVAADGMPPTLGSWLGVAGGRTFDGGLYRVHSADSARASQLLVRAAFPELSVRLRVFGYDWLGRQFATDESRGSSADKEVVLLEPGTGEALEIPVAFSQFHDRELVDHRDEALSSDFFAQWRAAGGRDLRTAECVGYRQPLFLGGVDSVRNLEITDIDVYWTLMGQLRQQTRGVPAGTPISVVAQEP